MGETEEEKRKVSEGFCPVVVRKFLFHARAILMDFPMLRATISLLRAGRPIEALAAVKVMRNNRMGIPLPEWFGRVERVVHVSLGWQK